MTYHDNDVYFQIEDEYNFINGSYTVEDFKISSGQDPDGHIKVGQIYNMDKYGNISFSVGRHGTSDVADWFNNLVKADQNTFGHTADKLNFAFMGTLVLTISGGNISTPQRTFTFKNVAIAQGHAGTTNNWWFGGPNCTYVPATQANTTGTDDNGKDIAFLFFRGNNPVNCILAIPSTI